MKRFWMVAGALAVTLGALWLAMMLGSAGFNGRRYGQHRQRLLKVMQEPEVTVSRLTQAFAQEGTRLVAAPASPEEEERVIAREGARRAGELRAKAARYPELRVFATADMYYFVFFDRRGLMRDFTLVSR
jgi:hypothetical protein